MEQSRDVSEGVGAAEPLELDCELVETVAVPRVVAVLRVVAVELEELALEVVEAVIVVMVVEVVVVVEPATQYAYPICRNWQSFPIEGFHL